MLCEIIMYKYDYMDCVNICIVIRKDTGLGIFTIMSWTTLVIWTSYNILCNIWAMLRGDMGCMIHFFALAVFTETDY